MNIVCKSDQARNYPIYAVDQDFGCFEFSKNNMQNTQLRTEYIMEKPKEVKAEVWKLYFDGSCLKEGVNGAGVVLTSPEKRK